MFARLWWKEARQTWPVWAFLACVGLGLQGFIRLLVGPGPIDGYGPTAGVVTVIYLFLVAAAAFAGERENGTLGLLDALPVDRLRLWGAKASFALATTFALGALLSLSALAYTGYVPQLGSVTIMSVVWGLLALGWGLFWSAVLGNALHAAVLAMASLGATLVALVNLQEGPSTEAAPALLLVGLATAAASALAFIRGGPPRWEGRRGRPAPSAVQAPSLAANVDGRRPSNVWTSSVGRLVWETWRQILSESRVLLAVAAGAIAFYYLSGWHRAGSPEILILVMATLGVMTGVATFNGENPGRTHRFLYQHGARPGVAWGVKVLMWWAATATLWAVVLMPGLMKLWAFGLPGNILGYGPGPIVVAALGALSIPFAIGALCGMVFRRGILAGSIAVVAAIVLAIVFGAALAARLMEPVALPCVALTMLAVTWAWSGDWLRYAPGIGKWARLALWCGLGLAVLVPSYIASRAWVEPTLTADEARNLFQTERFLHARVEGEDAAPLYREAERLVMRVGPAVLADGADADWHFDVRSPKAAKAMPVTDPGVVAWLEKVEPALAIVRKASRLPDCAYEDLRKATIFRWPDEPALYLMTTPLALSAQARLARGDLDGAWGEIETMLRMARQYSTVRGRTYFAIEPVAVGLAVQWAADPRQTAESLERALAAFRVLPPGATPADRARVERIAFQNTTALSREDIMEEYYRGYGPNYRLSTLDALRTRLLTTPWELARARKVYDLLAGVWIQTLRNRPYPELARPSGAGDTSSWLAFRPETYRSPHLQALVDTTPAVQLAEPGGELAPYPSIEAGRRVLGLVLKLRLYQARHDGSLPHTLNELPPAEPGAESTTDLIDPYSGKVFGYIRSSGQPLLPLAEILHEGNIQADDHSLVKPSDGCWLLYSVGPDLLDDRAWHNLDNMRRGDLVYPLKEGVKPPSAGSR